MATNASVQAYAADLAAALARARAAGSTAIRDEAQGLEAKLLQEMGEDGMADFIRPHVKVVDGFNSLRVRVLIDGKQAAADAHVAAGKKIDPNFDLALEREFGSRNVTAHPFFFSTIRANAVAINARIGAAIFAALFDGLSGSDDVYNAAGHTNITFEPGDEAHSSANIRLG